MKIFQPGTSTGGGGSGTVTGVLVATANGLAGTSDGNTATPTLTLTTSITAPVLAGNGTAIAVATTTGSGSTVALATGPTFSNPIVGTQATSDNSTKAASTAYVSTAIANAVAGVNPAVAVQAATTANVAGYTYNNGVFGVGATLTQNSAAVVVIDGYTLLLLDRVLFKNQSTAANNGVYFISTLGTGIIPAVFTRALDYDQPSDINNTGAIPVVNGTANAVTSWLLTSQVTTVGTDSLTYTQFSYNPSVVATSANNLSFFASTTSAQLASIISDETGSGALVFATSPTLVTPTLGAAIATSLAAVTNNSINIVSGTYNTIQTYSPTAAGTATLDLSKGNVHYINMPAGNITIALSNGTAGQFFEVRILQDATGSRTVTWFTTIKWAGGTPPTLTTTASKADALGFGITGTNTYDGCVMMANL